jgi:hypothetical protein
MILYIAFLFSLVDGNYYVAVLLCLHYLTKDL